MFVCLFFVCLKQETETADGCKRGCQITALPWQQKQRQTSLISGLATVFQQEFSLSVPEFTRLSSRVSLVCARAWTGRRLPPLPPLPPDPPRCSLCSICQKRRPSPRKKRHISAFLAADVWVMVGSDLVWQLRAKRRQISHTHAHVDPGGSKGRRSEFPGVFRNTSAHVRAVLEIRRVCLS